VGLCLECVVEGSERGLTAPAGQRHGQKPIGEPGVFRKQWTVQVRADGAAIACALRSVLSIVSVAESHATKRLGIVDRITPAAATRERRSAWADAEQAKAHFRSRALFRHFSEECLDDYVRHGLVTGRGGLRLLIEPSVEAAIYRTIPHDMGRHLRALRTPAGFIGGARSDVVKRVGLAPMRKKFVLRRVPGGHLFPFEHPREAAAALVELLASLAQGAGSA